MFLGTERPLTETRIIPTTWREAGKLNTMVGAPDALFAEIKPILETFCERNNFV